MKTLKAIIVITIVSLFSISCSKDDAPDSAPVAPIVYGEEDPLFKLLSSTPNSTPFVNAIEGIAQRGYVFKPTVKGKINSFIVKLPAFNNTIKIFLWDKTTLALVRSETVNVSATNIVSLEYNITPIELVKDKEYILTLYTDDYYYHSTNNQSAIPYPIIAGNIQFLGTRSGFGELCPQAGGSSNSYDGDISFKFQRTE